MTDDDCVGDGGRCGHVRATVDHPSAPAKKLCVGDAFALVDAMYDAIVHARGFVDISSLWPPDGHFLAMLRNAFARLHHARPRRRVQVRMLYAGDLVTTATDVPHAPNVYSHTRLWHIPSGRQSRDVAHSSNVTRLRRARGKIARTRARATATATATACTRTTHPRICFFWREKFAPRTRRFVGRHEFSRGRESPRPRISFQREGRLDKASARVASAPPPSPHFVWIARDALGFYPCATDELEARLVAEARLSDISRRAHVHLTARCHADAAAP